MPRRAHVPRQSIQVACAEDGKEVVRGVKAAIYGDWAVHEALGDPPHRAIKGPWWTVTHVGTGRAFIGVPREGVAVAVARKLSELPVQPVALRKLTGRAADAAARSVAQQLAALGAAELRAWVMSEVPMGRPRPNLARRVAAWRPGGALPTPARRRAPKKVTMKDLIRLAYADPEGES